MALTSRQVAAIKMKSGRYDHSSYYKKKVQGFVDRYNRNVSPTPTAKPTSRDVIIHQKRPPVRATRRYKV